MRICWSNLEKLRINNNGNLVDDRRHIYIEMESCKHCKSEYLTVQNKPSEWCCQSCRRKDFRYSEKSKQKMSKIQKKLFKEGVVTPFMKGKKGDFGYCKKVSIGRQKCSNEEWSGFITDDRVKQMTSDDYRIWRKTILERDDFTCQVCGKNNGDKEVHHIWKYSDYEFCRLETFNGITLCKVHHDMIKNNEENYAPFFFKLILNSASKL